MLALVALSQRAPFTLRKSALDFFLVAEYLDVLLAVHHFLDEAVELAEVTLLLDVILRGELCELAGDKQHYHGGEKADDRQDGAQHKP